MPDLNKVLLSIVLCFFCLPQNSQASDRASENEIKPGVCSKLANDYSEIYRSSENAEQLLLRTTDLGLKRIKQLGKSGLNISSRLPSLQTSGSMLTFNIGKRDVTIDVAGCQDEIFKIQNVSFTYDPGKDYLTNISKIPQIKFSTRKAFFRPYWLFPANRAFANSPQIDPALLDWYDPRQWDGRVNSVGTGATGAVELLAAGNGWAPVVAPLIVLGTAATYVGQQGRASLLMPSCRQQVADVSTLLKANHLELADIDCSGHLRMSDRSISFREPSGEIKKLFVDWDVNLAWWKDTEAYRFKGKNLTEFRQVDRRNLSGTAEFEKQRAIIEPYLPVVDYIGSKLSCKKCEGEIRGIAGNAGPAKATGAAPVR